MMKVHVGYPTREEEKEILWRMAGGAEIPISQVAEPGEIIDLRRRIAEVYMDQRIVDYIVDLVRVSREPQGAGLSDIKQLVAFGASPRASIFLAQTARAHAFLRGRAYVVPEDVKALAPDVLRHRILLTFEAEAEDVTSEDVIEKILEAVDVP
jgi:MoxR-like ATPase